MIPKPQQKRWTWAQTETTLAADKHKYCKHSKLVKYNQGITWQLESLFSAVKNHITELSQIVSYGNRYIIHTYEFTTWGRPLDTCVCVCVLCTVYSCTLKFSETIGESAWTDERTWTFCTQVACVSHTESGKHHFHKLCTSTHLKDYFQSISVHVIIVTMSTWLYTMLFSEVNKPVWCIRTHAVNNHCYYTFTLE